VSWDVIVVGAGPAGLAAATAAASAGARTAVLERAVHPRYKVCGGGLLGWSTAAAGIEIPVRDQARSATFARDGRLAFTRRADRPLVAMVLRGEFDAALREHAVRSGAVVLERRLVRGIRAPAQVVLAGGEVLSADVIVGADGSAGVSAQHVGVRYDQVDLGLERELAVPAATMARWQGRLLLDWGPLPGSYGWVFPKGDSLTVGVIAERGHGAATRAYLAEFVRRQGLGGATVSRDGGHLTKCRAAGSPLRRGRVIVAGDAAGLLEPWTREGISYALRSGAAAGRAAAAAVGAPEHTLDGYAASIQDTLIAEMDAGKRLYAAFRRRPAVFHALLATPPGWRAFQDFCRGDLAFRGALDRVPLRRARHALRPRRAGPPA
jgi:geranylgeranyl reductase family protein